MCLTNPEAIESKRLSAAGTGTERTELIALQICRPGTVVIHMDAAFMDLFEAQTQQPTHWKLPDSSWIRRVTPGCAYILTLSTMITIITVISTITTITL